MRLAESVSRGKVIIQSKWLFKKSRVSDKGEKKRWNEGHRETVHCSNINKQAAWKHIEPKVPVTATGITYLPDAENYWGENLLGMDRA